MIEKINIELMKTQVSKASEGAQEKLSDNGVYSVETKPGKLYIF